MVDLNALSGLNLLVVGLGREGLALAEFFRAHGLAVTATDSRPEETFGDAVVSSLAEQGVSLVLGQHPLDLLEQARILFVSGGVPLNSPFIQAAIERGLPLCTESKLFCYLCPATIIGITGSSGKTTTTTLVGKMLAGEGRRTWVGGNIGRPLISDIEQIRADDVVVMELSSFQLEYFHAKLNHHVDFSLSGAADPADLARLLGDWSPAISAILNVTPNHLDRHPTMKEYVRAKRAIINYQGDKGVIVLSLDNDMTRTIGRQFGAKVRWFSLEAQMPNGAGLLNDNLVLFGAQLEPTVVAHRQAVKLRGSHNLSNILAACLLAKEAGASIESMREVITTFTNVEHRLEVVAEINGVTYINDSISTTPERLMAALNAFSEPLILLAGGRDKRLPWNEAAWLMLHKAQHIILFGEAADLIETAIDKARGQVLQPTSEVHRRTTLDEAVELAAQLAQPGAIVLLSPGCASYDAFGSYVERAARFRELVNNLSVTLTGN